MPAKVTAAKVLEAKTPAAAAKRFHTWLTETWDARGAVLWSPEETKERGLRSSPVDSCLYFLDNRTR